MINLRTSGRLFILVPLLLVTVTAAAAGFVVASGPSIQGDFLARKDVAERSSSAKLEKFRSRGEAADWPPFTMVYELEQGQAVMVGNRQVDSRQMRRLEYGSPTQWKDTVIESAPIDTRVGTFSKVGCYQTLDGRKYTEFDAATNSFGEEEVEPGTRRVPSGFLVPFHMLGFEIAGLKPTPVLTTATVCFRDNCQENAHGLLYIREKGQEYVFAADSRGIPLRVGTGFLVRELRVEDERLDMQR